MIEVPKDFLVGTFVGVSAVPRRIIKEVSETFVAEKIFVFETESELERKFLITFNVTFHEQELFTFFKRKHKNTLTLHRKKASNTLYTLNSLNEMIKLDCSDKTGTPDWSKYQNCCVLTDKEKHLKILKTRLYDLIEF